MCNVRLCNMLRVHSGTKLPHGFCTLYCPSCHCPVESVWGVGGGAKHERQDSIGQGAGTLLMKGDQSGPHVLVFTSWEQACTVVIQSYYFLILMDGMVCLKMGGGSGRRGGRL